MKGAVFMSKPRFSTRTLTTLALLLAMEIVLSRFLSVSAWNIKIGFSFIPIIVAAVVYGPLEAGIVAALGDFLGAILFPIGPYFPGFTLTAFLTGCVSGFLLHNRRGWLPCIASVVINQFILSLFLNTWWLSILYDSPYVPLLATRIFQSFLLTAVQVLCIPLLVKLIDRYGKKVFFS